MHSCACSWQLSGGCTQARSADWCWGWCGVRLGSWGSGVSVGCVVRATSAAVTSPHTVGCLYRCSQCMVLALGGKFSEVESGAAWQGGQQTHGVQLQPCMNGCSWLVAIMPCCCPAGAPCFVQVGCVRSASPPWPLLIMLAHPGRHDVHADNHQAMRDLPWHVAVRYCNHVGAPACVRVWGRCLINVGNNGM